MNKQRKWGRKKEKKEGRKEMDGWIKKIKVIQEQTEPTEGAGLTEWIKTE